LSSRSDFADILQCRISNGSVAFEE
jgi:hypothetical protein